jgi:hypothetical protein
MGMHARWSGEYEYEIEVLPLVPPMSNGNSHEAKVARFDRRQRSSRLDFVSPLSFGLRRAKTEAEAPLVCALERAYAYNASLS